MANAEANILSVRHAAVPLNLGLARSFWTIASTHGLFRKTNKLDSVVLASVEPRNFFLVGAVFVIAGFVALLAGAALLGSAIDCLTGGTPCTMSASSLATVTTTGYVLLALTGVFIISGAVIMAGGHVTEHMGSMRPITNPASSLSAGSVSSLRAFLCPSCRGLNIPGAEKCRHCGARLPAT